jgi:hypothetical protein
VLIRFHLLGGLVTGAAFVFVSREQNKPENTETVQVGTKSFSVGKVGKVGTPKSVPVAAFGKRVGMSVGKVGNVGGESGDDWGRGVSGEPVFPDRFVLCLSA